MEKPVFASLDTIAFPLNCATRFPLFFIVFTIFPLVGCGVFSRCFGE